MYGFNFKQILYEINIRLLHLLYTHTQIYIYICKIKLQRIFLVLVPCMSKGEKSIVPKMRLKI